MEFKEETQANGLAKGFISAYANKQAPVFVPVGADGKQGYFEVSGEHESKHMKNLIVDMASQLIANRLRPGASWGNGITHLEVGTGFGSGTLQAPEAEIGSQTALRTPLLRKEIDAWTFLDEDGEPTGTATNALQLTTVFDLNEANGALVEMGLFGGDATDEVGTGLMFNYKTFPVWNKQEDFHLTVVWKLIF